MQAAVFNVPDITILRSAADGWAATLGGPTPSLLTQNNNTTVLIDGFEAFDALVQSIKQAQSRVHLLQLFWVPDFVATFTGGSIATNATHPKDVLQM